MRMELALRFDYGSIVPWVRTIEGTLVAIAGPDAVLLRTPIEHEGRNLRTHGSFSVAAGERVPFVLRWFPSNEPTPEPIDPEDALTKTLAFWEEWAARCTYEGTWHDAVHRSLLTLKALTYRADRRHRRRSDDVASRSGSAACGTGTTATAGCATRLSRCSRSCARATSTRRATGATGCCARSPARRTTCRSCTASRGERRLTELELPWLAGYEGSQPGPDRQRRLRPAAARRVRRGRGRALPGATTGARPVGRRVATDRQDLRLARVGVAASRTRGSGRCAARDDTSRTRRSWPGSRSTVPSRRSSGSDATGHSIAGRR